MFINYGNSPENKPDGNRNIDKSIVINSCGTYRLVSQPKLLTCRPNGRIDYQLIYIASGTGYFYFDDDAPTRIDAGNMVLYRPREFQKYIYFGKDRPAIYWIHFTGSDIDELLGRHAIDPSVRIIAAGTHPHYVHIFERIIAELQLQQEYFEESVSLFFTQLVIAAARFSHESMLDQTSIFLEEVIQATAYFHEHYRENINMESYIGSRCLGISSFFRKFKQYTGVTPLQYLLDIRLSNARKLLETTDHSVSEIASMVGYDNALYFSRLFHKHTGLSPREYKKSICADRFTPSDTSCPTDHSSPDYPEVPL